jgi:hypothetical protein
MIRKDNMPLMVYAALLGINSRRAAMAFVWTCIAIAAGAFVGTIVLGIQYGAEMTTPPAVACFGFLASAAWYSHAIKWVDRNSSWATS